ncbi:ADP-ribosyltransferase domain-containing protein [Endozoicomonas numazuensis]|nr:ADP-ribosyltransferase domain-containing protein [Endozoicomonas numazuensis]
MIKDLPFDDGIVYRPSPPPRGMKDQSQPDVIESEVEFEESLPGVPVVVPLSVDELIDTEVNLSNSLNGKEGEEFKNNALIDYHLNPDVSELTRDEYLSLHVYTTELYRPINSGLRGFSPDDKVKWSKVVQEADSALEKMSKNSDLKFEGMIFRGDKFSDELIDKLFPEGGVHQDLAFKSSSHDPEKAFSGNTQIKIMSKSGVKIEDVSVISTESEVLFRPGTKFKVISKRRTGEKYFISLEEI